MTEFKILYVYILQCSDGSYYTGVTNNMELRLKQHNSEVMIESYTYCRRPVELVYCQMFTDYILAITTEKKIKGWTRRKKEALIERNWEKLKEYSKCINQTAAIPKRSI